MTSKKISLLEFEKNPNIGLYMFINDKFCLIGENINENKKKEIEKIISVPIYNLSILNTQLIGVFISGNNNVIIIPEILDYEKSKLEIICNKYNVKLIEIKDKLNTFGNNICIGDEEILISKDFNKKFENKIKKLLNMNIIKVGNEKFSSVGGLCRFINGKYYVSQELNEEDFKNIINKISGIGTINSGSNFISSGVVGNKNGILIGSDSTTIEIQSVIESFDD